MPDAANELKMPRASHSGALVARRRPMTARRLAIVLGIVVLAIQLVPVDRTNPPVTAAIADVPPAVAVPLRRACYDCHSHETLWPWYSAVAPIAWLVAHDVDHGREHLNFSTWGELEPRKRAKRLEEIVEVLEEDDMPPWLYDVAHRTVRLDGRERDAIVAWARGGQS
jgi:hypothetical protein